jgi:hypothetical protein
VKRIRLAGHVLGTGVKRDVCMVLTVKSEGELPLGKLRLREKNNIKVDLEETGFEDTD